MLLVLVATASLIEMERGWAQRQFGQDAFLRGTIGTELMPLLVAVVALAPAAGFWASDRLAYAHAL